MSENVKTQVSKYVSYLLRHNPENLKMDMKGFVPLDELLACMHSKTYARMTASRFRLEQNLAQP